MLNLSATRCYTALFALLILLQCVFSHTIKEVQPALGIVPTPPKPAFSRAIAMGDEQFLFRAFGMVVQTTGDTFGRFTALNKYDYKQLFTWFRLLDELDDQSDLLPSMASYYFSQTQYKPDVRYVVEYLHDHAKRNPKTKWWWLVQAIYHANHKLNDKELVLKVAKILDNRELPIAAQQMLAIVYERQGEFKQAWKIMETIEEYADTMSDRDLRYMEYFIKERLEKMEEMQNQAKGWKRL